MQPYGAHLWRIYVAGNNKPYFGLGVKYRILFKFVLSQRIFIQVPIIKRHSQKIKQNINNNRSQCCKTD